MDKFLYDLWKDFRIDKAEKALNEISRELTWIAFQDHQSSADLKRERELKEEERKIKKRIEEIKKEEYHEEVNG